MPSTSNRAAIDTGVGIPADEFPAFYGALAVPPAEQLTPCSVSVTLVGTGTPLACTSCLQCRPVALESFADHFRVSAEMPVTALAALCCKMSVQLITPVEARNRFH